MRSSVGEKMWEIASFYDGRKHWTRMPSCHTEQIASPSGPVVKSTSAAIQDSHQGRERTK